MRKKLLLMCPIGWAPLVRDFADWVVDLPKEFYELGLETDCYESPPAGSPPGSLTPPNIYAALIEYVRNFYNKDKAIEMWTPRGVNHIVDEFPQKFMRYYPRGKAETDRPIVVVAPRARSRARNRNVPEFVWKETVDRLSEKYNVVIIGTPGGACLADYEKQGVFNLVRYSEPDKMDLIIDYMCNAICTLSSQSGPTHLSLLCFAPTYVIGHEMQRHSQDANRLNAPVTFRYVTDYRAIDAETIIEDVEKFVEVLQKNGFYKKLNIFDGTISTSKFFRPSMETLADKKDLVGVEIGVNTGTHAANLLECLDIKKLYLVDPYRMYGNMKNVGCQTSQEECNRIRSEAHTLLDEKYGDKIVWLEDLSENVVDQIPNGIDFAYSDSNHHYDWVLNEIKNYYPKIREDGGVYAIHDYDFPDVKKAVDEFFGDGIHVENSYDKFRILDSWVIKGEISEFTKIVEADTELLHKILQEEV